MIEKFKILAKYIKDMSSETADVETYLFVKENISKYHLNIDITSKALKNRMREINTALKFEDKEANEKKSHFEIVYAVVTKINENVNDKKELEKIILCEIPNLVFPALVKVFIGLIHNAGYPALKFEKKVDFYKLFNDRIN